MLLPPLLLLARALFPLPLPKEPPRELAPEETLRFPTLLAPPPPLGRVAGRVLAPPPGRPADPTPPAPPGFPTPPAPPGFPTPPAPPGFPAAPAPTGLPAPTAPPPHT